MPVEKEYDLVLNVAAGNANEAGEKAPVPTSRGTNPFPLRLALF